MQWITYDKALILLIMSIFFPPSIFAGFVVFGALIAMNMVNPKSNKTKAPSVKSTPDNDLTILLVASYMIDKNN